MLDSTVTDPYIEKIREIVNVTSKAEVAARVNSLDEYGWTATIEDLGEWTKVRNKFGGLSGGRFGIVSDKEGYRLELRNRVRTRLGYPAIDEQGQVIPNFDDEGTQSIDVFGSW